MGSRDKFEPLFFGISKLKINDVLLRMKKFDKNTTNFIILTYHDTSKEKFLDHMQYLDKKYSIISFDEFIFKFLKKEYPGDPTFIITFDDGFNSVYRDLYSVSNKLSIPIMVYITTDYILNRNTYWWDDVEKINKLGGYLNKEKLKTVVSKERDIIIENYKNKYNIKKEEGCTLDMNQLLELNNKQNISFGSHTITHANLSIENELNIKNELLNSKNFLETILKKEVNHIAYPYGKYNEKVIQISKNIGYKTAVTTKDYWVSKKDNQYEIPRVGAGLYGISTNWLESRISRASFHK